MQCRTVIFPYNAINKCFAWCEKSLNNNSVRQLLDVLLAVVLYSGVEQLVARRAHDPEVAG